MSRVDGLVGRKPELERIERFLDVIAAGPMAFVIEGPPGIGKTAMWRAAREAAAARGMDVRSSRTAAAEAKLSLSTLLDLLDPVPDAVVDALAAPRRDALLAALLRQPTPKPPDQRTLGVAVLDVLRALSCERSLLLAIDDEQWLDRSSAAVLAFAFRRLQGDEVGLLTTRPESEALATRGAGVAPEAGSLSLGPMDLESIDVLIEERLGMSLPLPTLHRVHDMSRGNPLFALEIARGLAGDDLRIPAGKSLPIAADLHDRLELRLGRLPSATRDALLVAASAAEPRLEILHKVTGDIGALGPAVDAGIVEVIDDVIRFTHPLLAAAAGSSGTEERGRKVHRLLAGETQDPEVRARHLALAVDAPDPEVAARLDEAARRARARSALPDAAELSDLAVRATPPEADADLARRRIDGAKMYFLAGDDVRGIALAEQVLATVSSGPLRAEAILVHARRTYENVAGTLVLLEDALGQPDLSPALRSDLHVQYAWTLWRAADPEAARQHALDALELAETDGGSQLICEALLILGAVTWALGLARPDELFERALELEAEEPSGWLYVRDRPGLVVADLLGHDGRFEEATSIFADLLREARQAGDEPSVASVLWNLGTLEIQSGDWLLAREHLAEAVRLRNQQGMPPMEALASLAMLRACEGHIDEARADAAAAIATATEWHDLEGQLFCLQAAGLIELTAGAPEVACQPLMDAAGTIRSSPLRSPDLCGIVADEIEALIASGRIDEALCETGWLEAWTDGLGGWTRGLARRSRGHLLAAQGDLDGARLALGEANAQLQQAGFPFEHARALLLLGAVERRAKQKRAAREAFSRAAAIFDALGAPEWAERVRSELGRVGGRAPAPHHLTETERQIADLVAGGHSNREIAESLFMSRRTVESHLTSIYRKLGIRSRTELAATVFNGRQ